MCIAVIGGMKRQESHYRNEARQRGIDIRIFNVADRDMERKLQRVDAIILFTGKISHTARHEVIRAVRRHNILLYQCHTCGLCTLRDCLNCLGGNRQAPARA